MFFAPTQRAPLLALIYFTAISQLSARADNWTFWAQVPAATVNAPQLANDGTNIYFTTLLDGVYRATLADRNFSLMPMTGFPLWNATTNTNGFAVQHISTTPQGTIVIAGSQISVSSNSVLFNPPGSSTNTLPVFYWWEETNQVWHAAAVTGKNYPYTGNAGNFSVAPDGSLWACSGFYPYAYRSTNGGISYTAFDINARVPTNYFPLPLTTNQLTFGEIFSVCAGWNNEVVIGTETGGFLHTTNNGATWRSLDPNYTNTNSTNPLGRTGDARVAGIDHYGNFLCRNFLMFVSPARSNWLSVPLIGWRPRDDLFFNASGGFTNGLVPITVLTPPSGVTFGFANQNYLLQGGVFRARDGKNWAQFNQGSGLDFPFSTSLPNYTNLLGQGGGITLVSNVVFIGVGSAIYVFDSTPSPVANRPPTAHSQVTNLRENSPTNLTLNGSDADGDALNFTLTTLPAHGTLTGTPPDLFYTPTNHFLGLDEFQFVVDDGALTSAPSIFNLAINSATNLPPVISFNSPMNGSGFITPTNISLSATASDDGGFVRVNFYDGTTLLGALTNAPFTFVVTNPVTGGHTFFVRATDNFSARTWASPVTIFILPVAPLLKISAADSKNIAVTWPFDLDGFFIESAPEVNGPWTLSPYPQLYFTNGQTTTIPKTDQQFFRLMLPQ